jgi:hypothetical protein
MIVTDSAGRLALEDVWDLKALSFATDQPSNTPIAGIQWADDEHVTIAVGTLRDLAGDTARDPEWAQGFAGMIAYATSKGWVDDAGAVRMHVERSSAGEG